MTWHRATAGLVAVLAGSVLVTGCTGGDDPAPTSTTGASESSIAPEPSAPESVAAASPSAAPAGVVSGTFTVPDAPDDTVDVSIESLTVSGKTLELRAWFTPHGATLGDGDTISIYRMTGSNLNPTLDDVAGLARYFVLTDTGQRWATDAANAKAGNGQPVLYQAWFAAPESKAATLDVQLTPSWAPFENVPVTYEG